MKWGVYSASFRCKSLGMRVWWELDTRTTASKVLGPLPSGCGRVPGHRRGEEALACSPSGPQRETGHDRPAYRLVRGEISDVDSRLRHLARLDHGH